MGMSVSRTTDPLRFDVGIGSAGYADVINSPESGEVQKTLLPGTTTVTQAMDEIFPPDRSVIQTGKVYYDVERNETLPFEVHTTDAMVRVLGTSFQIDESAERTSVDVVSGRVFFAASCDIGNGLELTNGMHAEICDGLLLSELSEAVTMNPAAWATHHFVYGDAPIEAVLEDLSSAFGRTIVCDLDGHRLSGDFYADSLEEAVSIIETTLDVKLRVL